MFDLKLYLKNFFNIDNKSIIAQWVAVFNQMAVHTRKKKPTELLLKQRPNEEEDILKFRLENYRAITYGSMNRALDSVCRILNRVQYEIVCDDATKKYLETKNFSAQTTSYNFSTYFEKIILKRDIEDPNGFLLWLPSGEGLNDDSKEINPIPVLCYCDQLHDATPDVLSILSDEKSPIKTGDVITYDGDVYYILTKDSFYKFIQTSKPADGDGKAKFKLVLIYKHNIGEIPALVMGGDMNAEGYFESFFAPYCAFGDEAVAAFSDFQAVRVTSAFPYTEEFYTEELYEPNKEVRPSKGEQKYQESKRLKPIPRTPYGVRMRPIPKNEKNKSMLGENDVLPVEVPFKRFINPDPEILKFSNEVWEKMIEFAEDALHLNLKSNFNQTEGAKETDKEEHYAMIDKISNNYFDHLMINSVKYIDCYRNRKKIENSQVTIIKPSTYKIRTEQDLIDEIKALTDSKAPDVFISEITNELAKRRFSGSPLSQKLFEAIAYIDPLYIKTNADKTGLVNSNIITKEAYIRSVYCYSLLLKIASEMTPTAFVKAELKDIESRFNEMVKQFLIKDELPELDDLGNPILK